MIRGLPARAPMFCAQSSSHAILDRMMRVGLAALALLIAFPLSVSARGVSPYLPLNLDPATERMIERVLILADKPVMRRPIAAATVLDALPAACRKDVVLCEDVRRYLSTYMHDVSLTHASVEGAITSGSDRAVPNRYGLSSNSEWAASVAGFWQPDDRVLLSAGAVAYPDEIDPTGSMLSLGYDFAQLDIGYRPHWLSPFSGSSMLISTEAQTFQSVTLSNYRPLTRFGLQYELFVGRLSTSDHIVYQGARHHGAPESRRLSRRDRTRIGLVARGQSRHAVRRWRPPGQVDHRRHRSAVPSRAEGQRRDPRRPVRQSGRLGDEQFPVSGASTPFNVYFEYGGEDTSRGGSFTFGNASLAAGIHFPRLWR